MASDIQGLYIYNIYIIKKCIERFEVGAEDYVVYKALCRDVTIPTNHVFALTDVESAGWRSRAW